MKALFKFGLVSSCCYFQTVHSFSLTTTTTRPSWFYNVQSAPSKQGKLQQRRRHNNSCSVILQMTSSLSSGSREVYPDRQLVYQGMEAFRKGDIKGSIQKFDASVPPNTKAYLWQRGISYYYNNQFELGSQQFRDDVLQSPLDVEEIVWDIACLLRIDNTKFPPSTMLSLPPGKKDRRPIMVR